MLSAAGRAVIVPYTQFMPATDNEKAILTPEMLEFIGRSTPPVTYVVRARDILEFNAAIAGELPDVTGDARDVAVCQVEALGTIVRSFLSAPFDPPFPEPFIDILDGGSEYEFHRPILAGDEIEVVRTMLDVYSKRGRLGPMLFKITEVAYTGADGGLVATQRSTSISYGRSTAG